MWDLHTHLVPSGDDGVDTLRDALLLARRACARGTRVLYATPHVNDEFPLTGERLAALRAHREALAPRLRRRGLELRLGWEVAPPSLGTVEPELVELEGLGAILVEAPLDVHDWSLRDALDACASVAAWGYRPLLAHPERSPEFARRPDAAAEVAALGGAVQLNAGSLTGGFGPEAARAAWAVVRAGVPAVVGSDAHGHHHPADLDDAYRLVVRRAGTARAGAMFRAGALRERAPTPAVRAPRARPRSAASGPPRAR